MAEPPRLNVNGFPISNVIHTEKCGDCGMGTVDVMEWHPYAACVVFKEKHDSREVWRELYRLIRRGEAPWQRGDNA